mmetsp:Transcript_21845/g.51817  ORF Transcript_21845/g.51817 Transcript_21845/m.51817 type:complete len:82 (+) Transcript_21845:1714-1959(+)
MLYQMNLDLESRFRFQFQLELEFEMVLSLLGSQTTLVPATTIVGSLRLQSVLRRLVTHENTVRPSNNSILKMTVAAVTYEE